eukprot:2503026-Rhodomonas_salina.3
MSARTLTAPAPACSVRLKSQRGAGAGRGDGHYLQQKPAQSTLQHVHQDAAAHWLRGRGWQDGLEPHPTVPRFLCFLFDSSLDICYGHDLLLMCCSCCVVVVVVVVVVV